MLEDADPVEGLTFEEIHLSNCLFNPAASHASDWELQYLDEALRERVLLVQQSANHRLMRRLRRVLVERFGRCDETGLAHARDWLFLERNMIDATVNRLTLPELLAVLEGAAGKGPPFQETIHNADFTMVQWYGAEYHFALGIQSSAVRALWEEWERSGLGLHQETIRQAIDVERDSFRMDTAFRGHPAFRTMIQSDGDGRYRLVRPDTQSAPATRKDRKKTGSAPKSPQKRV
jgi:hypothetical protein